MMTITEMKAAAYDTMVQIQHLQEQLARINQAIMQQAAQEQQEALKTKPVEETAKTDEGV